MTLTWNALDSGKGFTASGNWVWEVVPYESLIDPSASDLWILRGRSPHRRDWKYFGGYQGLSNVQSWAQREDESSRRLRYPNERADSDDE